MSNSGPTPRLGKNTQARMTVRFGPQKPVDTSPHVSDEVKTTTCYMCACRCGIKVHLADGRIRYIEGNKAHPVTRGVLFAKGPAGIMQHYSPARLSKPLLRTEIGRASCRERVCEDVYISGDAVNLKK